MHNESRTEQMPDLNPKPETEKPWPPNWTQTPKQKNLTPCTQLRPQHAPRFALTQITQIRFNAQQPPPITSTHTNHHLHVNNVTRQRRHTIPPLEFVTTTTTTTTNKQTASTTTKKTGALAITTGASARSGLLKQFLVKWGLDESKLSSEHCKNACVWMLSNSSGVRMDGLRSQVKEKRGFRVIVKCILVGDSEDTLPDDVASLEGGTSRAPLLLWHGRPRHRSPIWRLIPGEDGPRRALIRVWTGGYIYVVGEVWMVVPCF